MFSTIKFDDFQDWFDACSDLGLKPVNLHTDVNEYHFEEDGHVVAYWDRKLKKGAISDEIAGL
jgi:hypothetical protein